MKAFIVSKYGKHGLQVANVPKPIVGPQDVLVRIKAASINPLDIMVRNGDFKLILNYKLPFILGHDVAGVIEEIGSDVSIYKIGDEIFARPRDMRIGTFAELISINQADIALKPKILTMEEAAAIPLVALAAWQTLVDLAQVTPAQKVLVHGGAGGLGSTVIQLAKNMGAYVATTANGRDQDKLHALGADEVIDYTKDDFSKKLFGYDLVIDSLGGANLIKSLSILKPNGLAISVVGPPDIMFANQIDKPLLKPVFAMISNKVHRIANKLGVHYSFFFMKASGFQLIKMSELYSNKKIIPIIDKVFPFDKTLDAIDYVETGKAKGKIVISFKV